MIRRRPSNQTWEERQRERDASSVRAMGLLFLGLAALMVVALVGAVVTGDPPDPPWLWVPLLGGIVFMFGLGLTVVGERTRQLSRWLAIGGGLVLFGSLTIELLISLA